MYARTLPAAPSPNLAALLIRLAILLLPASLLWLGSFSAPPDHQAVLHAGAAILGIAGALILVSRYGRNNAFGVPTILLYLLALLWLILGTSGQSDARLYVARSLLLVIQLGLFGLHCIQQSGVVQVRRARRLADRLVRLPDLPPDLPTCRTLPAVQALREALTVDAAPALALLGHPRPEVRVASLAALEFRTHWQPGQIPLVLHVARQAADPDVRAAAVLALGCCASRTTIEPLADYLSDPALVVRRAAAEALLWDTHERWPWLRNAFRMALAHPECFEDGPLTLEGVLLSPEAIGDLTAWCAEKGLLAIRAAQTLGSHYQQALALGTNAAVVEDLRRQVADPHTPAPLRLELARALQENRELDESVLRMMIDPSSPAPLRLIGVETLLAQGNSPEAVAALHELARLPNREIALAVAEVVQRRLGADLGLPRGQPMPPVHTRLASDVARRVQAWATRMELAPEEPVLTPRNDADWKTESET
jgi:hypothetical protein